MGIDPAIYYGPWAWKEDARDAKKVLIDEAHYEAPPWASHAIDTRSNTKCGTPGLSDSMGFFAGNPPAPDANYSPLGKWAKDARTPKAARNRIAAEQSVTLPVAIDNPRDIIWHLLGAAAGDGTTRPKPIMPFRQRLDLLFAGRRLEARFNPGDSRSDASIAQYKRDYEELRAAARRGELPTDHHRKWMGAVNRQMGRKFDDTFFLPANRKGEKPLRPTTTLTEDFATNGDLSSSADWTAEILGGDQDCNRTGGRGQMTEAFTNDAVIYFNETALAGSDHFCELENHTLFPAGGQGQYIREIARSNSKANYNNIYFGGFYVDLPGSSRQARIYKIVNGTWTNLNTVSHTDYTPEFYRFDVSGSALTFTRGSSSPATTAVSDTTDTSHSSGSYVGFFMRARSGSAVTNTKVDNFLAEDAAIAGNPWNYYQQQAALAG